MHISMQMNCNFVMELVSYMYTLIILIFQVGELLRDGDTDYSSTYTESIQAGAPRERTTWLCSKVSH